MHKMKPIAERLRELTEVMHAWVSRKEDSFDFRFVDRLQEAAEMVQKAWSGSSIGYHARVYFRGFQQPPRGANFSSEWGLSYKPIAFGTAGDWEEYTYDEVIDYIREKAGNPDLAAVTALSNDARNVFEDARDEVISLLTAFLAERGDEYINTLKSQTEKTVAVTKAKAIRDQRPSGSFVSRDGLAMSQGLKVAPHQEILAEVAAIRSPFHACGELATISERAAAHIERILARSAISTRDPGRNVFIGHGHSSAWRELKDFLQGRLLLPWDEFDRVPVAGITNIARLAEMLDDAGMAFLVLTAEDERVDGSIAARQNVVHEAGLFQGRLGFTRAIVLLEEGCEEFSNIHGLGQIRFPAGKIDAAFEEVRRVLEREEFLAPRQN
jgi:predicted nucleotide-binding protein